MDWRAARLSAVIACSLLCFLFPAAIVVLGQIYGPDSDPGMDPPWSSDAIDCLFWSDLLVSGVLIWLLRGWLRWVVACVAIGMLCLTGAIFNGLWVSGQYF